ASRYLYRKTPPHDALPVGQRYASEPDRKIGHQRTLPRGAEQAFHLLRERLLQIVELRKLPLRERLECGRDRLRDADDRHSTFFREVVDLLCDRGRDLTVVEKSLHLLARDEVALRGDVARRGIGPGLDGLHEGRWSKHLEADRVGEIARDVLSEGDRRSGVLGLEGRDLVRDRFEPGEVLRFLRREVADALRF